MDAILRIKAALAAGPTEGPWIGAGPSFGASVPKYIDEVLVDREGDEDDTYTVCQCPTGLRDDPESNVAMAYIAEVNPTAIREVLQTLAAKDAEIARLSAGLKWYADGNHVAGLDDDWDTVSGEPQNWLCGPESGMVENGGVAKTVLDGGYIVDDDEIIAEPAMTAEQHKTKLARIEELMLRNPDADSADGMELQQLAGEVERHEKRAFGPALTQPTEQPK